MAATQDSASRLTRKTAFSSPEVHPLVLDLLLVDRYGANWLLWEPETLWSSITTDFSLSADISRHVRAGVQAVKTLHANDSFWMDWEVTNWITQVLSGVLPDFEVLQIPSPGALAHAVTCARILRKNIPYDDEVQKWMAACLLDAGIVYAPSPLEFIQDDLAMVEARCRKCGNIEWPKDLAQCPACGAPRSQLDIRPKWEWEDVRERWAMIKDLPAESVVLTESRVDVQMARLLLIRDYVRERLDTLRRQLGDLGLEPSALE